MRVTFALGAYALVVAGVNACGGTSKRHGESDATGADGGTLAQGGTGANAGASASGGTSPGCPSEAPTTRFNPECSAEVPPEGCTYLLSSCQNEPQLFTVHCGDRNDWVLDPASCQTGDFCSPPAASQVHCIDGAWTLGLGGEQADCPTARPSPGLECVTGNINYPPCGYHCADGSWTIASCDSHARSWTLSPGCAEDHVDAGAAAGREAGR